MEKIKLVAQIARLLFPRNIALSVIRGTEYVAADVVLDVILHDE